MSEIVKEYAKDDLTVVWKPKKCIHAAECVKALPQVYNPNLKPWIKPENASMAELKSQIDKCPSGALSYYMKHEMKEEKKSEVRAEVLPNGPVLVHGKIEIKLSDGTIRVSDATTAFCRCGSSASKPYCDGSHIADGFKG